ncbi:hypothetical protein H4I95_07142 [Botrytis cinerea]
MDSFKPISFPSSCQCYHPPGISQATGPAIKLLSVHASNTCTTSTSHCCCCGHTCASRRGIIGSTSTIDTQNHRSSHRSCSQATLRC